MWYPVFFAVYRKFENMAAFTERSLCILLKEAAANILVIPKKIQGNTDIALEGHERVRSEKTICRRYLARSELL